MSPEESKSTPTAQEIAALFASMERSMGGAIPADRPENERKAQELYYRAREAKTAEEYFQFLDQALESDPGNTDALLETLDLVDSPQERIAAARKLVDEAAKRLGEAAFVELAPHFWAHHEARPYMRARARLAEELCAAGRMEEAMPEYEGMLALSENDNQGLRYRLLVLLFTRGHLDKARALLERFPEDCLYNPLFGWGCVLERFLARDEQGAQAALQAVHKQNPASRAYLLGHRSLPKTIPHCYSIGSREEAICFAEDIQRCWEPYPAARAWVASRK